MSFKHGMFVPVVSVLGTLINYDDDDNNAKAKKKQNKKNNWVYEKNNSSAWRFLVHLFDVQCTTTAWNLPMRRFM